MASSSGLSLVSELMPSHRGSASTLATSSFGPSLFSLLYPLSSLCTYGHQPERPPSLVAVWPRKMTATVPLRGNPEVTPEGLAPHLIHPTSISP